MVAARNTDLDAAIALTRFSMGARIGELRAPGEDARGYLKAQIRPQGADQPVNADGSRLKTTAELFADDAEAYDMRRSRQAEDLRSSRRMREDAYQQEFLARAMLGIRTQAGFRERWALFWCNHFACTRKGHHSPAIVGAFEREAIRPHVFGKFSDLLLASIRHPAMLLYLDQVKSFGPSTEMAQRRQKGLNENLAREVMELHSLGVEAGYTQNDVTEMARALTGWNIDRRGNGAFTFREELHEPGARQIYGKRYPDTGEGQARAALIDFAANSHTARHLATKIARHFVADEPPPALVDKLAAAYRESGGQLDHVATALIDAPEAWDPAPRKFKTPYEFVISGWRAAGATPDRFGEVGRVLQDLGQRGFQPPSPKGWEENGEDWAGAAAIMARMEWVGQFSARFAPNGNPVDTAKAVLGPRLSQPSATAIARAESRNEAFALMLMIPEFQRR